MTGPTAQASAINQCPYAVAIQLNIQTYVALLLRSKIATLAIVRLTQSAFVSSCHVQTRKKDHALNRLVFPFLFLAMSASHVTFPKPSVRMCDDIDNALCNISALAERREEYIRLQTDLVGRRDSHPAGNDRFAMLP
jgi:hypothetical protein